MAEVMARSEYFTHWSALHGGYDPSGSWSARTWLGLAYACSRPLASIGVRPTVLTGWAVAASLAAVACAGARGRWPLLGAAAVVAAGLLDSLDGAVAVLTSRASRWGFVLDSVADRVSDGLFLLALWFLGAPAGLAVAAGAVTMLQEYVRARAGNAGMAEIGIATVAERPSRVIVTGLTLLGAGLVADHASLVATIGVAASLGLGLAGAVQLLTVVHRKLSAP